MIFYTSPSSRASRADRSSNSGRRHRADFARQATIDAFGWRYARALDQGDFMDREPWQMPMRSPEARFR